MDKKIFFLLSVAAVAVSLIGCASPQRGMTRLEVLSLLVEIDERDNKGMKPADKSDLLKGQLALERMRSGVHLSGYERCQSDFRDLEMENAALRAANRHLLGKD